MILSNGHLLVSFDRRARLRQFYYPRLDAAHLLLGGIQFFIVPASIDPRALELGSRDFQIEITSARVNDSIEVVYTHRTSDLEIHRELRIHPRVAALTDRFRFSKPGLTLAVQTVPWIYGGAIGHSSTFQPSLEAVVHMRAGGPVFALAANSTRLRPFTGALSPSECQRLFSEGQIQLPFERTFGSSSSPRSFAPITFGGILATPDDSNRTIETYYCTAPNETQLAEVLGIARNPYKGIRLGETPEEEPPPAETRLAKPPELSTETQARLARIPNPVHRSLAKTSLEVILAFQDSDTGAIMAAAEEDPLWRESAGYGYSWPRDGAYMARALDAFGCHAEAESYLRFLLSTQAASGEWGERYLADGTPAPSGGRLQIDETATAVEAIWNHFEAIGDQEWLRESWGGVRRALEFLSTFHANGEDIFSSISRDIWEERTGTHIYSLGASIAAFRIGARIARLLLEPGVLEHYNLVAQRLEAHLHEYFLPRGGSIRRGFTRGPDGTLAPDETVDASMLGLIYPFRVYEPGTAEAQKVTMIVERWLWQRPRGGVLRYAGDRYKGGHPWTLTTLWLGLVAREAGNLDLAEECLSWAVRYATPEGLLPEQVHREAGTPHWVTPLGWSHAMFLLLARGQPG